VGGGAESGERGEGEPCRDAQEDASARGRDQLSAPRLR
jgi:hypothetical protein